MQPWKTNTQSDPSPCAERFDSLADFHDVRGGAFSVAVRLPHLVDVKLKAVHSLAAAADPEGAAVTVFSSSSASLYSR